MSFSLPTSMDAGHVVLDTEWASMINSTTAATNINLAQFIGTTSYSSASATYGNVTGATISFTKVFDSSTTGILVVMAQSCYSSSVGGVVQFGINDGSLDYDVTLFLHNVANTHNFTMGIASIFGEAAGSYTFQLRAKSPTSSTINIDAGDCGFIYLAEVDI